VVTTGVAELDTRFLKLPLASAQRLAQTDSVSNLLVGLDDTRATGAALAAARAALAGRAAPLAVTPWSERAPFYGQVRDLYLGIFVFLGTIVVVLVVLAASNTLVMSIMERVREIGTLRAIGNRPRPDRRAAGRRGGVAGCAGSARRRRAGAGCGARPERRGPPDAAAAGAVDPIDLRLALVPRRSPGRPAHDPRARPRRLLPAARAARLAIVDALGHV